jgi:superfamily II DNA/RNA helicase
MQQRQRLSKLERFSTGKVNTLICTDLAARGLDMLIDVVVQYGVPLNGDTYVHRLGRTARAGRSGESFILVSKKEYSKWKDILSVVSTNKSKQSDQKV